MIFSYDEQEEVVSVDDDNHLSPELEEVIRQLIESFEEAESIGQD